MPAPLYHIIGLVAIGSFWAGKCVATDFRGDFSKALQSGASVAKYFQASEVVGAIRPLGKGADRPALCGLAGAVMEIGPTQFGRGSEGQYYLLMLQADAARAFIQVWKVGANVTNPDVAACLKRWITGYRARLDSLYDPSFAPEELVAVSIPDGLSAGKKRDKLVKRAAVQNEKIFAQEVQKLVRALREDLSADVEALQKVLDGQ